jgi:hypothetical protein
MKPGAQRICAGSEENRDDCYVIRMTPKLRMTPKTRDEELLRMFCPLPLKPADEGRWVLWWPAENTWVVRFPTEQSAYGFMLGRGGPHHPGIDYSEVPVDLEAALHEYKQRTGTVLQRELDESHNIMDLYGPLGLAGEHLARLLYYELSVNIAEIYDGMAGEWTPLVRQVLTYNEGGPPPEHAVAVTALLLQQTKSQVDLVEGIKRRCRQATQP